MRVVQSAIDGSRMHSICALRVDEIIAREVPPEELSAGESCAICYEEL